MSKNKLLAIVFPSLDSERFMNDWNIYKDLFFSRTYREFIGRYLAKLMSKKEFRALSISDDEIMQNDEAYYINFNLHDIPKLKSVQLDFYFLDNNKQYYLGNEGVEFDLVNQLISANTIDSWYGINDNLISAKSLTFEEKEYLLVDVFYNNDKGILVYEVNEDYSYVLKHLLIIPEDNASREIIIDLNLGDTIYFRYINEKYGSIKYQNKDDLEIKELNLSNFDHGYEFSTVDVLGRITKSKMLLAEKEQPLGGYIPFAPLIVVGILLLSVIILRYLIKSE
ncbi:MAG: hypothetical protein ACLFPS_09660 [Clostridia bacterium]